MGKPLYAASQKSANTSFFERRLRLANLGRWEKMGEAHETIPLVPPKP